MEKKWPDNTVKIGVFYMRHAIDIAPRDGKAIIIEDDASGTYDVAHWSPEAGEWVGENGEPSKITPTHWYPMPRDKYLLREDEGSSNRSQVGHARRRLAASSITATLIAAALIGLYFRAEVAVYVTRYASQQDIFGVSTIGGQVFEQEPKSASQDSRKTDLFAQQQAEADQARVQEAPQVKQAVEAPAPDAGQSLEKEPPPEVLANELAQARRAINEPNLQPRAGAANSAQSLEQEREKTAALVQDAATAQQELTASTVQHRHTLEEERTRGAALASELAMARHEIETNVALLNKARDDAARFKQTAERTTAEQQQQERDRAEALSRELAMARHEIETNVALLNKARDDAAKFKQTAERTTAEQQQERDRAEALSRELAMARHEIETNVASLNKARDDAAKFKQTAERTTTELQQERDRAEALSRELTTAHESAQRATDVRTTLEPTAGSQIAKVPQSMEATSPEQPAATVSQGDPEVARLMVRASALLGQGNIGAARIVLEHAAETGSAQASFMLAETYDPAILAAWGTYGTRGEATKARELYAKAHAGGIQEAKNRFDALDQ